MDKHTFIKKILSDKKITQHQRERILRLAAREIGEDGSLEERVRRVEGLIFSNNAQTFKTPNVLNEDSTTYHKENRVFKRKHLPKEMVKFLYKFSSDDKYKWFTHEPDLKIEEINYLNLLNYIKKKLYYPNLNYSTTSFIQKFLFDTTAKIYYPDQKISLTYGSKEILDRLENGDNPFTIKVGDTYFKNTIESFKRAIEFRLDYGEKNRFSYLLKDFILANLSIDFTETYTKRFNKIGKTLNTYIDTNNFFSGIKKLINWINHYKSFSKELEIDLEENQDFFSLIIFHKNSYIPTKASNHKLKGTSGDFGTLRKYWFSIVDFEIQADLKMNNTLVPYSIVALDKNTGMYDRNNLSENSISQKNDTEKVGGVKYLIKIYKTKNL